MIAIWGLNWPIMKIGVQHMSPLWFAATRMLLGSVVLFAFLAARREIIWPGWPQLPILISVGLFQIGLPTGMIHYGLLFMEAGRSSILVFTIPLWVVPMAVVVLGERLSAVRMAGLALGLTGIVVLFDPRGFDFRNADLVLGNGLMLAASLSFAIAIIVIRRHAWPVSVVRLIPWQMLFGTAILIAAAAVIEGRPATRWTAELVAIMAYNGPIASALAFWAWVLVSRDLPAMSTGVGSLGVPVVGVLASVPILGESVTITKALGLMLIGAGVTAISMYDLNRGATR